MPHRMKMKMRLGKKRILLVAASIAALAGVAVLAPAFFPGPFKRTASPGRSTAVAPSQLPANEGGNAKPPNTASNHIAEQLRKGKKPNRLIKEKSPYLLQHAFNPVDWYPWGEEAFARARGENRPIFLSVGYSTCYWCHVMEREVFENPEIAAVMNRYLVSIKVDREERPDVDRVYMTALQAMTGSGGWPMSMFLTPDRKPFFGGTYFPPDARYGRPGFPDLVRHIHEVWTAEREKILQSSERITALLKDQASISATRDVKIGRPVLAKGFDLLRQSYDRQFSGFDSAPKFPRPVTFNFLLRFYHRTGERAALEMTLSTLKAMAKGGLHDHIGLGFHRYSTDAQWRVPHFEKMLYDQGQLACSYLDAYQITHDEFYAATARSILEYVLRNLTHKDGGFYSAEDAESALDFSKPEEKEEGTFYLWTRAEIDRILGKERADLFCFYYGVEPRGNAPNDPQGVFAGKNVLYIARTAEETARQFRKPTREVERILAESRKLLFSEREKRPKPHLDDKVLVSWNGLMVSAFARAYQVLEERRYLEAAERAADFILAKLYNPRSGQLQRRYREGDSRYEAHLEDYAFFALGLLDLYEASLEIKWLERAMAITETQNKLFWDPNEGGFFDTSGTDKTLLLRTRESYDGAEPAGNSVAVLNLLRLSQMTDNRTWREMAEKTLSVFAGRLERSPTAMPQMLAAVDFLLDKPKQIILAGRADSPDTRALIREIHRRYIPNKIILLADGGEAQRKLASYIPFIQSISIMGGRATAYVCEDYACELPTSEASVMSRLLDGKKAKSGQGKS